MRRDLDALGAEGRMTPDLVFRDPYVLDFLALPADYSESELEIAILRDLEAFLLELGTGFSFVARQKRTSIGPDDYYLDLLFFHRPLRPLRALVAIELKLGRFDARDKGQMELYLRWLDKHERQPGESAPLGLILCADKNDEQIELLELNEGSLRVARYLTELPPRELYWPDGSRCRCRRGRSDLGSLGAAPRHRWARAAPCDRDGTRRRRGVAATRKLRGDVGRGGPRARLLLASRLRGVAP